MDSNGSYYYLVEGRMKGEMRGRMNFSMEEYQAILAKQHKPIPDDPHQADDEPESTLSKKIRVHCKAHGWPALILPQSKLLSHFIPEGWLDGVITLPSGSAIFLELKSKKGELRKAQRLMVAMLLTLGHEVHKVKTWKRFLEIVYRGKCT